jgi:hypothetical protein
MSMKSSQTSHVAKLAQAVGLEKQAGTAKSLMVEIG